MKTRLRSTLERVVTYGLIVVAVAFLFYFLGSVNRSQRELISSKETEIANLSKKVEDSQKEFALRRQQIEDITVQLRDKRKEVKENFERLLEASANYTIFIEQVQRKAKALDVHIQDSTYKSPAPVSGAGGNYVEFKFDMRIQGPYNKLKQFLWESENALGRLVKISHLEIVPPLNDQQGNMAMKLTLSTFFVP
ncbi:MAG TPA: type 4a pilus biogenesis protein PilO [Candidatus Rifleibacterium sp.]|nr:type 4a pilus biogenesis protein PilO [Candidatus Rifleibacterium sp.]HPT44404.1 type 4a pilus biogenesis protein PilO [Candidatus Rifleibacterium sp.]